MICRGTPRRRKQRVLGHSFLLKYKRRRGEGKHDGEGYGDGLPNELVEESILFTRHNIGRKRARYVRGLVWKK